MAEETAHVIGSRGKPLRRTARGGAPAFKPVPRRRPGIMLQAGAAA